MLGAASSSSLMSESAGGAGARRARAGDVYVGCGFCGERNGFREGPASDGPPGAGGRLPGEQNGFAGLGGAGLRTFTGVDGAAGAEDASARRLRERGASPEALEMARHVSYVDATSGWRWISSLDGSRPCCARNSCCHCFSCLRRMASIAATPPAGSTHAPSQRQNAHLRTATNASWPPHHVLPALGLPESLGERRGADERSPACVRRRRERARHGRWLRCTASWSKHAPVSYTHLRAHET